MTLATAPPEATAPAERRVVLENVTWEFYESMCQQVADSHIRLTFDDGRLEIMSPSDFHERVKTVIGRLIETYAQEVGMDVDGLGSTTFRRGDLRKGLEPDECYYVTHAAAVRGKKKLDLTVDPPPDLAIEVDISPPDVARQPIYAALGVPEVWRYDGRELHYLCRTSSGEYRPASSSGAFPDLPAEQVNRCIQIALTAGQTAAALALRQWVRQHPAPGQ